MRKKQHTGARETEARIIDWTDRIEVMNAYRKYERLNMVGPNYSYWNGKLIAPPEPAIVTPPITEYSVDANLRDE